MKYVLVTGGVVSGLGKGITSSSIGVLLKASGINVTSIKIDPYLNTDAGTMSPFEHGEVYVLEDGGEVDLDLGNYERFLQTVRLTSDHNITTGKVYAQVLARERKGDYLGKTVQVVPHVTDAIQEWIERVANIPVTTDDRKAWDLATSGNSNGANGSNGSNNNSSSSNASRPEVCCIELGGTVGDIESMVFLEALRQFRYRVGQDNVCHVHVSLVPVVGAVGEPKSKPTQHGVRDLRAAGLSPDIIICRSSQPLNRATVGKISQFCMVPATNVISVHDVSNIYKVPLLLLEQRVGSLVLNTLRINKMCPDDLKLWRTLATKTDDANLPLINIAVCGKYTGLSDSYLSVTKALSHAAIANDVRLNVVWIDSEHLEPAWKLKGTGQSNSITDSNKNPTENEQQYNEAWSKLKSCDGVLVPGGFGYRGVEGMMQAVNHARTSKTPFFGICLGMQVAVIEYARNVCSLKNATSSEFDAHSDEAVIMFMPETSLTQLGGTMRLGGRVTSLQKDSLAYQLYGYKSQIYERHRHRYEVNPDFIARLTQDPNSNENENNKFVGPLIFSGKDDSLRRMECVELDSGVHPFFFGSQYHPEFTSRPGAANPCFSGFVSASAKKFVRVPQPNVPTRDNSPARK